MRQMSLKNKLNRMKKHVVREESKTTITEQVELNDPFEQVWKDFQTTVFSFDDQKCLVREVSYPLDYQHGHYQLGEFHQIVSMWNESNSTHPLSCKGHEASDLFFFDT